MTIVPEISWGDLAHVFADRPRSCMAAAVLAGARATWPKVGLLRARTAAELAIDSALLDLRARLGAVAHLEVIGEACNNVVKNHPDFARSMLRCRGALLMKCAMHWPTAISLWTWASSGKPCRTTCQRSGRK